MSLWCHFHDIYRDYHDRLHKQGIAYEGMLYQEVAEHCSDLSFPHKAYLFVGFNVIQQVEQHPTGIFDNVCVVSDLFIRSRP